jgi:predicted phage terminase large subunit-like protein
MIRFSKIIKDKVMKQVIDTINILSMELSHHRRNLASRSPRAFAEVYMQNTCNEPFSQMHEEIFSLLLEMTNNRKARLAIAAPRGHAKSTIVDLVYVLWCVLYHKERLILIASNTQEQAVTLLKDIKGQLKSNPLIVLDFPEICRGEKPKPWRDNKIQLPNGTMICVYGVGQNPRGIKHDRDRPGLIIADDLENEEQAESEEQRDKLRSWFSRTLLNTGHPHTNVVVIGTILHQDSLLATLVDHDRSPGWNGSKYKAVNQFCSNPQLWEKWASIFRTHDDYKGVFGPDAAKLFFEANRQQMLEGTKVLWADRESYYDLMVMRETEGPRSFQSEKQNEPIDPQLCVFKEQDLMFWDDKYRDVQHLIQCIGSKARFYGACDPSMGKNKRGDYTAIVVLMKDYSTKIIYVIAADLSHLTPSGAIDKMTEYARMYGFERFAIESNNFQQLMVNELKQRIVAHGRRLIVHEITNRSNKQSRIMGLEPYVKQGYLRFSRKHTLLLSQLTQFPLAKNDDGPDALEMAVDIALKQIPFVGIW